MKKIMFNDRFGLTQAVLEGRKTMTRRVCKDQNWSKSDILALNYDKLTLMTPPNYFIGEVVAIAQSYNQIGISATMYCEVPNEYAGTRDGSFDELAGWENKMFVKADLMPHHIRITNIRVEHLQDISDEDCLREGVYELRETHGKPSAYSFIGDNAYFGKRKSPREAFAALIDKVSGRGTWDSNPMVWVYEFELVD